MPTLCHVMDIYVIQWILPILRLQYDNNNIWFMFQWSNKSNWLVVCYYYYNFCQVKGLVPHQHQYHTIITNISITSLIKHHIMAQYVVCGWRTYVGPFIRSTTDVPSTQWYLSDENNRWYFVWQTITWTGWCPSLMNRFIAHLRNLKHKLVSFCNR